MAHKKTTKKRTPAESIQPASAETQVATDTSTRLRSLYVRLASDPGELSAFIANPQEAAKAAGLSPQESEVLFSGDQGRIYLALRPESASATPPAPVPQPGGTNAGGQAASYGQQPSAYPYASYYGAPQPVYPAVPAQTPDASRTLPFMMILQTVTGIFLHYHAAGYDPYNSYGSYPTPSQPYSYGWPPYPVPPENK